MSNQNRIKVLSLFDGISCARVALERLEYEVEYYASEVDKYAMQIAMKNFPDTVQVGSVVDFHPTPLICGNIDLIVGGFPCQSFSIAGKRKGLDDPRGQLVFEMFRLIKEVKPKYLLAENVASMKKDIQEYLRQEFEKAMGEPVYIIQIDATLVSAQRRKRIFFTNIPNITQPEDRRIMLKDILEDFTEESRMINPKLFNWKGDKDKAMTLSASMHKELPLIMDEQTILQYRRTYWRETKVGKVPTLTANMGTGGNNVPYVARATVQKHAEQHSDKCPTLTSAMGMGGGNEPLLMNEERAEELKGKYIDGEQRKIGIRKLTTIECERLQSLNDGYTEGVSNTQRYKALGNAFNVEVVKHILSFIK